MEICLTNSLLFSFCSTISVLVISNNYCSQSDHSFLTISTIFPLQLTTNPSPFHEYSPSISPTILHPLVTFLSLLSSIPTISPKSPHHLSNTRGLRFSSSFTNPPLTSPSPPPVRAYPSPSLCSGGKLQPPPPCPFFVVPKMKCWRRLRAGHCCLFVFRG